MRVKFHGPKLESELTAVLDQTAGTGVRYLEFAPPVDLADWIEAIAIVSVPRTIPDRAWRLLRDQRARASLPLGGGHGVPQLRRSDDRRDVVNLFRPGQRAVVRFAPWANGALGFGGGGERWWSRAEAAWNPTRVADLSGAYGSVCDWLRLALPPDRPDPRAARYWTLLEQWSGRQSVATVARSIAISPRTLRRLIKSESGCPPSRAREIERLRAALRSLRMDLELPWARAAVESDCCDQSHFNRAFRKLAGLAPSRFFGEGHHHANDVFALRVTETISGLPLRAVGLPRLREPGGAHPLIVRHRPVPHRAGRSGLPTDDLVVASLTRRPGQTSDRSSPRGVREQRTKGAW